MDGGVIDNIPVSVAREKGADIVIAVDIGENVIGGGLAEGIESFVGPLMNTMSTAMRNITTAAATVPSQTSTSYQYNSSYNLTINSNANAEQVAADFGMMQSLAGV